jgi:23S rRNA pseudouridine1911/1915/1917 synthase
VYCRDYLKAGQSLLPSPRLLLHAATLGFAHPHTGEHLAFSAKVPADKQTVIDGL